MSDQEKTKYDCFANRREVEIREFVEPVANSLIKFGIEVGDDRKIDRLVKKRFLLAERMRQLAEEVAKNRDFADQQVPSNYGYLSGYTQLDPVEKQLETLQKWMKGKSLTANLSIAKHEPPKGAEGYLVIPRTELLGQTYVDALKKAFGFLEKQRNGQFTNHISNTLTNDRLRQHPDALEYWQTVGLQQADYEALIVPAQLGFQLRGCSTNRARYLCDAGGQVCLGALHVAIALLTHPNRMQHYDDLWIFCSGDERDSDGDGQFGSAPDFYFHGDRLQFDALDVGSAHVLYGSASAFPPQ